MRIVVAMHSLAGIGGTETQTITSADHLQRLGHDVWLHSIQAGAGSEMAESAGLRFVAREDDLPDEIDAAIVHDAPVAYELAARYPLTPQLYIAHSDVFDLQLPPQVPDVVAATVVLYDRVERRVRNLAHSGEVVRLTQPVDVQRFKPIRGLPERARVAVTLGNYVHGERLALLERACLRAGIELRHVGSHASAGQRPAEFVFNDADIVFGKARVIHEAMACGRAAFVYDHNGGEGWVTAASYPLLSADNFGGQSQPVAFSEDALVDALGAYDRGMGVVNRDLIVANHSAERHAAALVEILARLVPRAEPVDAPLRELARLVRVYHRADAAAFALRAELERVNAAGHARESELERVNAAGHARESELRHWRTVAQENAAATASVAAELSALQASADQAWHQLIAMKRSARWRMVQTLLSPLDRARATRHRPPAVRRQPAPFIVGVGRSGTTLLRLLLDAHSELAIPPETGFGLVLSETSAPDELLAALMRLETWPDLGFDEPAARSLLRTVEPWSTADGLRALYGAYACRRGAARWGDKTPVHLAHMPEIAAALPEARFIHLIRDGRDVAASARGLPFAPGDGEVEAIAREWRQRIISGREAGSRLEHYREVRYEQLVSDPEAVLRELCDFLDFEFEPSMLRAHDNADTRFAELAAVRRLGDGVVTRAERIDRNALLARPPDPGRIGRWREVLTSEDAERFDAIAGGLLSELGYEPS